MLGETVYGGVAVANGVTEEVAVIVDEAEVDAPGVDANALEVEFVRALGGTFEAVFHVLEKGEEVPVDVSTDRDLSVSEAMDFLQRDSRPGDGTDHDTTATATKVNCYIGIFHFVTFPRTYTSKSSIS